MFFWMSPGIFWNVPLPGLLVGCTPSTSTRPTWTKEASRREQSQSAPSLPVAPASSHLITSSNKLVGQSMLGVEYTSSLASSIPPVSLKIQPGSYKQVTELKGWSHSASFPPPVNQETKQPLSVEWSPGTDALKQSCCPPAASLSSTAIALL